MNNVEKRDEAVPTNTLAKRGVAAIAQIAGGVLFLVMHAFGGRLRPLGIGLGLVVGGIGIAALLSKDPEDRKPGIIMTIAGALELMYQLKVPLVAGLSGWLFTVASLGLLALGIFNAIRFRKGLKSRE